MLQIRDICNDTDVCAMQMNYTSTKIVSVTEGNEMEVVSADLVSFVGEHIDLPEKEIQQELFIARMNSLPVLVAEACTSSAKWAADLKRYDVGERYRHLRAALDATQSENVARAMEVYPLGRAIIKTGEAVAARLHQTLRCHHTRVRSSEGMEPDRSPTSDRNADQVAQQ